VIIMNKKDGYTLIELLVVITLMVLLLGGGVATYFRFEERQSTEVVARELHRAFITARAKARFREKANCTSTERVIGFRTLIRDDGGTKKVDILSICGSSRIDYDGAEPNSVQNEGPTTVVYTIPDNVTLESPISTDLPYEVDFFTLYGGAWINGDPEPVQVPITVSRGVARYSFNIDGGADISPVVKLN